MNTLKNVEKLGRQAWLASLGAYGSGWKYAVQKFDQTYSKTNELVNEFITEGEKIEHDLQEKLKAKELLENKIVALKHKLGLDEKQEEERLDELSSKVDALTLAVNKLVESKSAEKALTAKATATKATAAKTTTRKTPAKAAKS